MICHECGSEVAETDVFCPFCGISLERGVPTDLSTDDSMASTIMNPPMDIISSGGTSEPSLPNVNSALAETGTGDDYSGPNVGSDESSASTPANQETKENSYPMEVDRDDIPASQGSDDIGKTADNLPAAATTEYSMTGESVGSEVEDDEASRPGTEMVFKDSAILEQKPEGASPNDDTAPASDPGFSLEANGDLFEDRLESDFEKISKPLKELESSDGYLSNSTFDSVRIIEGRTSRPDEADTRIQGGDVAPGPSEPAVEENAANKSAPIDEKVKLPTSQSMGAGDTDGKRSAKLKPLTEGTVLNRRYEIVRKIGGGGMGAVYLASDNNLGGVLRAVKEMVQAHIGEEQQEKAIDDFKRESMILSSLDHVSIPTIYDYFYDDEESRFYLVMKYISGGDLSTRLRSAPEGRIDEKCVTEWAIQIIDVLDYLHNQPSTIVYRDLKPSNIMIDGNSGRVMLIDFGIARSISQKEEKGVTAVGTMGYAPPELFSGNVEPRSDIYSLGSTMFHLLTGADPQSNPLLIFDFQKNPRPRQINPQLSDQIERILMRSVEYNADSRFRSAAEMLDVLEEHLRNLKSGDLTYGVTEIPASVSLANQSVFCGFCGQRIVATDLFCAFCGAKQPIAQQGVHSEIYSQGAWTAKLVIEGTTELAAPAFSLQKDENLLGRRDPMSNIFPEVDLSKYDPQTKISRRHARIWREGSNFMVEDLGSSNGTVLARSINDSFRLVPKQPHILTAGDKIKIGDATLHFVIG